LTLNISLTHIVPTINIPPDRQPSLVRRVDHARDLLAGTKQASFIRAVVLVLAVLAIQLEIESTARESWRFVGIFLSSLAVYRVFATINLLAVVGGDELPCHGWVVLFAEIEFANVGDDVEGPREFWGWWRCCRWCRFR
jgi:hypothetical protein